MFGLKLCFCCRFLIHKLLLSLVLLVNVFLLKKGVFSPNCHSHCSIFTLQRWVHWTCELDQYKLNWTEFDRVSQQTQVLTFACICKFLRRQVAHKSIKKKSNKLHPLKKTVICGSKHIKFLLLESGMSSNHAGITLTWCFNVQLQAIWLHSETKSL